MLTIVKNIGNTISNKIQQHQINKLKKEAAKKYDLACQTLINAEIRHL